MKHQQPAAPVISRSSHSSLPCLRQYRQRLRIVVVVIVLVPIALPTIRQWKIWSQSITRCQPLPMMPSERLTTAISAQVILVLKRPHIPEI